mmetsp:Transcript_10352/g.28288  ORF Transcript_10352/g.28288 Transcript_10352/m.28288 type:complete len:80 (-) Transcript_10352:2494-2733(-)
MVVLGASHLTLKSIHAAYNSRSMNVLSCTLCSTQCLSGMSPEGGFESFQSPPNSGRITFQFVDEQQDHHNEKNSRGVHS